MAVFFRLVSDGQGALIQGMRRISDLARMSVLAALFGTVISVPMVYVFREQGVCRRSSQLPQSRSSLHGGIRAELRISSAAIAMSNIGHEAAALLKLGVAFMASGFLTMGAAYAIRLIVLRNAGLEAAGLYQAAWVLGGLYVAFILQAMGADFYPRLTAWPKTMPSATV